MTPEGKVRYAEDLSQALAKLQADREILDSREFRMMTTARDNGLTYREIARAKGCTVQSVHQWFSRRTKTNGSV
jgi:DNA-directed RNA polymerase specialized sigma24 family protein